MASLVASSIQAVNTHANLNEEAVADLAPVLLRQEGGRMESAIKHAQAAVRAEPSVYQKGRARAKEVLAAVRSALPVKSRSAVRASIVEQLLDAKIERLSNPDAAVPAELRQLIEKMGEPAANRLLANP